MHTERSVFPEVDQGQQRKQSQGGKKQEREPEIFPPGEKRVIVKDQEQDKHEGNHDHQRYET